jgi:hypothetical protein
MRNTATAPHVLGVIAHWAGHHVLATAIIAAIIAVLWWLMRPAPALPASCSHSGGWIAALLAAAGLACFAARAGHATPPAAAPRRTIIIHQAAHSPAHSLLSGWPLVAAVAIVAGAIVAIVINTRRRPE